MTKSAFTALAALALPIAFPASAQAAPAPAFGDPVAFGDGLTFDPMLDARLRWEDINRPGAATDADAVTLRVRAGAEVKDTRLHISFLAEAEGTLALDKAYNAFSFAHPASQQYRPGHAVIADPENIELNRLQLQYKTKAVALTLGRQRINLDDQRWVGSVGWRQNEQTFDAVRLELNKGPFMVDGTYSNKILTIYGNDAGPRRSYDGDFVFVQAGIKQGPLAIKAFDYILDYGDPLVITSSSQTYGMRATLSQPLGKAAKLNLIASYARQSDYKHTAGFGVDYFAAEGAVTTRGLTATVGYESLGSTVDSAGVRRALQTPLATLHKFNGWADLFLTTPANGLHDLYGGVGYAFPMVKSIKGLNAGVTYHQFDSAFAGIDYGHEWDASVGFKTHKVTWLVKYAAYTARGFGVDTDKFWLQAEYGF